MSKDNENIRFLRFMGCSLLGILLVILGQFGFDGIPGIILIGLGVLTTWAAPLLGPRLPTYGEVSKTVFCGVIANTVALIIGSITFGWWGLAPALAMLVVFIFSIVNYDK